MSGKWKGFPQDLQWKKFKKDWQRTGRVAQVVECLPSK
jgi:hypothetical protein